MSDAPAYGLWWLVFINSAVFILFALSFTEPRTATDWRTLGSVSAFLVALFTEMYGFPLTLYLLSGWLQTRYPGLDVLSHDTGHLWQTLLGWEGNPHFNAIHLIGDLLIICGFVVVAEGWRALHAAQRTHSMAMTGPYRVVRHPQYVGFILIMFGFLLQWPTVLTLAMFPVLVWRFVRLARREEQAATAEFGAQYLTYAAATPAFLPGLGRHTSAVTRAGHRAGPG